VLGLSWTNTIFRRQGNARQITLKAETADPTAATLAEQQRRFDEFRAVYNHERPHEALGFRTWTGGFRFAALAAPLSLPPPLCWRKK